MLSRTAEKLVPDLARRSLSGAYVDLLRGVDPCFEAFHESCQRAGATLIEPIVREATERALGAVAEAEVQGPDADIDADELYARKLQAEEEAKRGRWTSLLGGSAGGDAGGGKNDYGGWQTVSRQRKRRTDGARPPEGGAPSPTATSARERAERVVEEAAAHAARGALEEWTAPLDEEAAALRNAGWGTWFDFDDASVRPAGVMQLPSLYGASGQSAAADCAYMLIYRSRAAEGGSKALGQPQHISAVLSVPTPPRVWRGAEASARAGASARPVSLTPRPGPVCRRPGSTAQ